MSFGRDGREAIIPVPYHSRFVHQIEAGQTIFVHGFVREDAKEFQLNLLSGTPRLDPAQGVVALHVDVRFDEGKIVLNSLQHGEWGKEERVKNTFHKGQEFDLRIRVHEDRYEVLVNQKEVGEFPHRVPINAIDHLEVRGDVRLDSVRRGGKYHTLPFESQFHDGHLKPGEVILINGIPTGDRFEIDFIDRHGNILFHLNPRLHEKKVVRSAFINGAWGEEEREATTPFPFKKDLAFDLVIQNQPYSIQIFINGKRFGTFAHRTADPKHDYHAIRCAGDFELTGLEISAPHGQTYEY